MYILFFRVVLYPWDCCKNYHFTLCVSAFVVVQYQLIIIQFQMKFKNSASLNVHIRRDSKWIFRCTKTELSHSIVWSKDPQMENTELSHRL